MNEIEDTFSEFLNTSGLSVKYYRDLVGTAAELRLALADTVLVISSTREYLTELLTAIYDDHAGSSSSNTRRDNFIPDKNSQYVPTRNDTLYPGYDSQSPGWRKILGDIDRPVRGSNEIAIRSRDESVRLLDKFEGLVERFNEIVLMLPLQGFGYKRGSKSVSAIKSCVRQVRSFGRIMFSNIVRLRRFLEIVPAEISSTSP